MNWFQRRRCRKATEAAARFLAAPVSAFMTKYVVIIKPGATIVNAATRMIAEGLACMIVEKDDTPIGILTQRDFLMKVPPSVRALNLKVSDVMTEGVVSVPPNATVADAFSTMEQHKIRKLLVIEKGEPRGFLTQTDLVKAVYDRLRFYWGDKLLVRDWMSKKIVSAPVSTTFAKAKQLMKKHDTGALPLTEKSQFVGIFTEFDVLQQFYDTGGILHIKSPENIMSERIFSVEVDAPWWFANRVMIEKGVRRLLVVENEQVTGIITQTDIARAVRELLMGMLEDKCEETHRCNRKQKIDTTYVTEHIKLFRLAP